MKDFGKRITSYICIWACPVCGKELKIGPAFMNFAPYCSDPKCSYNHQVFTAEATNREKETGEK